ncbi:MULTISPECIES: HAMP domain-containing sensor histidine kinase [Massilia]|jgi:signal transduction histidine kinase|uniref:sensor histidine kinase n=1 Tax=Massilia TaxID=149698 RepID=UPI001C6310D3|nr:MULTISPECIES: HAMP domain-containing sensor histidine kinase [Massilia]QYF99970.1 HAMP domain-containing histidine kinase [Massilia sp. NP310]
MHNNFLLSRRIFSAFTLFGFVLAACFSALVAVAVEGIEVHLVDNRLAEVEKWALPRDAAGIEVDLPAGLRFHRGEDIPKSLRGLRPGISDSTVGHENLHVLAGADQLGPYVVVDHGSDYEDVELVVYSTFAAFFACCVLSAAALGGFFGRRIVSPISELATAVAQGAPVLPLTDRNDELGFLARALEAHTEQLRRVLDRERFFTGDVSHELRTPLMVITGSTEILLEGEVDDHRRAAAVRVYKAAQEAAECINVMLLLAREPELGDFEPVSIGEVARKETERYQSLVIDKPVQLLCIGSSPIIVRAPAELCKSAVSNLIRNACQYTEQGVVTVVLNGTCLIVEDTGPGLPESVQRTLGQRDRMAPSSGSVGTGLGLSLVKRICDYLNASFAYEARQGGGSRFTIRFQDDLISQENHSSEAA